MGIADKHEEVFTSAVIWVIAASNVIDKYIPWSKRYCQLTTQI